MADIKKTANKVRAKLKGKICFYNQHSGINMVWLKIKSHCYIKLVFSLRHNTQLSYNISKCCLSVVYLVLLLYDNLIVLQPFTKENLLFQYTQLNLHLISPCRFPVDFSFVIIKLEQFNQLFCGLNSELDYLRLKRHSKAYHKDMTNARYVRALCSNFPKSVK